MSTSIVQICNLALGWVAAKRITDLNDNSIEAQLCRENYDTCRKAVLEDSQWTFANARARLLPMAQKPEFGFANKFKEPNDCLKTWWASDRPDYEESRINTTRWKREGNEILADTNTLYILYSIDVSDVNKFSNQFVHAVAARMAADFAVPLSHSRKLQKDLWQLYVAKKDTAASSDSQQGRNEAYRRSRLTRVREGGGRLGPHV